MRRFLVALVLFTTLAALGCGGGQVQAPAETANLPSSTGLEGVSGPKLPGVKGAP
jgi:hypothetical protein